MKKSNIATTIVIAVIIFAIAMVLIKHKSDTMQTPPTQAEQSQETTEYLPNGLFPEQVKQSYVVDGNLYTMVLEPNLNFPLTGAEEKEISWHGVMKRAANASGWSKFFEIKDPVDPQKQDQKVKYNPVGVFSENNTLYIDIANDRGAGSGEGQMIRFGSTDQGKSWEQKGCFYFIPENYYKNYSNGKTAELMPHSLKTAEGCVY